MQNSLKGGGGRVHFNKIYKVSRPIFITSFLYLFFFLNKATARKMNSWDNTDTREKTEINSTPSPDNNAWESNKQELPSQVQDQPLHAAGTSIDIPSPVEPVVEEHKRPSVPRLLLRVWQFFAAIGAFGFQVGATPVSILSFSIIYRVTYRL